MPPFVPYEGKLSPNEKLTQASYIAQKKIVGPETIVFTNEGDLYTGLMNGDIVRVNKNQSITRIARMGNEKDDSKCRKIFI